MVGMCLVREVVTEEIPLLGRTKKCEAEMACSPAESKEFVLLEVDRVCKTEDATAYKPSPGSLISSGRDCALRVDIRKRFINSRVDLYSRSPPASANHSPTNRFARKTLPCRP